MRTFGSKVKQAVVTHCEALGCLQAIAAFPELSSAVLQGPLKASVSKGSRVLEAPCQRPPVAAVKQEHQSNSWQMQGTYSPP